VGLYEVRLKEEQEEETHERKDVGEGKRNLFC